MRARSSIFWFMVLTGCTVSALDRQVQDSIESYSAILCACPEFRTNTGLADESECLELFGPLDAETNACVLDAYGDDPDRREVLACHRDVYGDLEVCVAAAGCDYQGCLDDFDAAFMACPTLGPQALDSANACLE